MQSQQGYQYSLDVNYTLVDKLKVAAQEAARRTSKNMERWGFREITGSRGESCYMFEYIGKQPMPPLGFVIEGLGTKNRAMDAFVEQLDFVCKTLESNRIYSIRKNQSKQAGDASYFEYVNLRERISPYFNAAVDTSMMIFLDMASTGVMPIVLGAHYAAGASEWFKDDRHIQDYCKGMVFVCNEVGCTWGPGETPVLTNVVHADSAVLDGASFGLLIAKEPILGQNIKPGNKIIFVESSGLHANYLSGARRLADSLEAGYMTLLSDGTPFGQAISKPTVVEYVPFLESLMLHNIKINYIVPITGHGLRKIMRARKPFTYRIDKLAPLSPLFQFMIEGLGLKGEDGAKEAMGGMNLGQGIALFVEADQECFILSQAGIRGMHAWVGGIVEDGPRQVIIENPDPIFEVNGKIVFPEDSMEIRAK